MVWVFTQGVLHDFPIFFYKNNRSHQLMILIGGIGMKFNVAKILERFFVQHVSICSFGLHVSKIKIKSFLTMLCRKNAAFILTALSLWK